MAPSFVRNLGTASSTSTTATTLAITVPAAGAAAGDLVVVRFGGYNYTSGTVSCADSKGNTYQVDWSDNSSSDGINVVFSSILTTALVSGNTITVTFPSGNQQYAMTADEFSGIASTGWAWQVGTKATGASTTPSDSITPGASPPANTLVLGVLFASFGPSDTFTEDSTHTAGGDSWHSLTASIATSGANQEGTRAAYKIPTSGNTGVAQTWAPTLGTSHSWYENLIVYKGSSSGAQTVSPTGIATTEAEGTPTLTNTGLTVSPTGIASTAASGTPTLTVAPSLSVSPTGIASTEAEGTPSLTVAPNLSVSPSGIAGTSALGTPTVALSGNMVLAPSGAASTEAEGTPNVVTLAPPDTGSVSLPPVRPAKPQGRKPPGFRLSVANTVTGQIVGDLPFVGSPSWSRALNRSGSLTVDVPLEPPLDPDMRERLAEPYRWTLVYSYGDYICQAGILVGAHPSDGANPTVQLTTQTFWDFLSNGRTVRYTQFGSLLPQTASDVVFGPTSPDPANQNLTWHSVARRLVEISCSGTPYTYFPLILPSPITGTAATITYAASDLAGVGQRLDDITKLLNGPEIEFSAEFSDSDHQSFFWRMKIGNYRLGQLGYPHAWDYKKACQSVTGSEDGSKMVFHSIVKGQDNRQQQGGQLFYGEYTDNTYPAAGWPMIERPDTSHSSVVDNNLLNSFAQQNVTTNKTPADTFTAIVRMDGLTNTGQVTGSPSIDLVSVGDTGFISITGHPWYRDGQYAVRILQIDSGADLWTAKLSLQVLGTT